MKSLIWTTSGYYRLIDEPAKSFDLMAGVRYADIDQSLDWSLSGDIGGLPIPGREGDVSVKADYLNVIIGFRGRLAFGQDNTWFLPYYMDAGTGDSYLTWQAAAGVGYTFDWGELAVIWGYLDYDLPSDAMVAEMNFSGPEAGVIFRW